MDRSEPCAKCRQMIYFSSFYTCANETCRYHLPCRVAPHPPAEQASGESVAVLREMRDTGDVSDWRAWDAALDAAIAALSQRPVVDEATVQQVIANLNNATAVMRDRPHGGGPDRAWLTSQVNLLRAALAPQQPTGGEE